MVQINGAARLFSFGFVLLSDDGKGERVKCGRCGLGFWIGVLEMRGGAKEGRREGG